MNAIQTLIASVEALFPAAGELMGWTKHKEINAAIMNGLMDISSPPGMAIPITSSVVPTGFHAFNGQALSRADYPKLYSLWGTTYGAGDGSTTFNCPTIPAGTALIQFGASGVAGVDFSLNAQGGEVKHQLTAAEMPSHNHTVNMAENGTTNATGSNRAAWTDNPNNQQGTITSESAGGGESHNNMPPYFAVNYIFRLC